MIKLIDLNKARPDGEEYFSERPEIDVSDVLRKRVESGQPIIVHLPKALGGDAGVALSLIKCIENTAATLNLNVPCTNHITTGDSDVT